MGRKVCIVGSGNWGSAIAMIVGSNAARLDEFADEVQMYVHEEMVDGKKLSEIINTQHENVKYLQGHKIPVNVIANPDLPAAVHNADILIFVLPHQFIPKTCAFIKGKVKPSAIAVSLIKGLDERKDGSIHLITEVITDTIGLPCQVLMGANLANGVAEGEFCESTLGSECGEAGEILKRLFQTPNFRINIARDARTVELCGALKNIVAVGAGFTDGLKLKDNTKAAVIRIGLMEMTKFVERFYPPSNLATFLESCGVADLVTTCYGGRNRRIAEAFVTSGKTIAELEKEMLNGQSAQGPLTAAHVHKMLDKHGLSDKFPLFTAIHKVCQGEMKPEGMIDALRNHPEHH